MVLMLRGGPSRTKILNVAVCPRIVQMVQSHSDAQADLKIEISSFSRASIGPAHMKVCHTRQAQVENPQCSLAKARQMSILSHSIHNQSCLFESFKAV